MATSTGVSEIGTCEVPMLLGTVQSLVFGLKYCEMSGGSDAAKSARERYICVAAMVIMASEGTWNMRLNGSFRSNEINTYTAMRTKEEVQQNWQGTAK